MIIERKVIEDHKRRKLLCFNSALATQELSVSFCLNTRSLHVRLHTWCHTFYDWMYWFCPIWQRSSSSSCCTANTDPPTLSRQLSLLSLAPRRSSRLHPGPELLYIGSSWSSCLCLSMRWGPQEYVPYELVLISPAVFCMSGSFNLDSFRDGW